MDAMDSVEPCRTERRTKESIHHCRIHPLQEDSEENVLAERKGGTEELRGSGLHETDKWGYEPVL
jgi:hypothetical protein